MSIEAIHLGGEIRLVSFDVFDTVIARRCGAPEAIFRLTGEKARNRGLLAISPRAYERQRLEAERRLRQHRSAGEITLAEIYIELNRFWFLPPAALQAMTACELQTERENLFAIPGAPALVEKARQAGKRIAFVSDMYLPPAFLQQVLGELGLFKPGDHLYVSSGWNTSKANGGLFRIVLEQERLSGHEMIHLGDSRFSDVERAQAFGIQARQIARGTLNRFEVILAQAEAEATDEAGTLAGLARQARLGADETGEHFVTARLGASLAGPLLTSYAEWVLRGARERKLKRLYFLARDGEAILRVCEVLAPALEAADIELRYLYGSREVWGAAGLVSLDETAAAFFAKQIAFSASHWEHCVAYLDITGAEISRTELPEKWAKGHRDRAWKQQIFRDLAAHPELGPKLKSRLHEKLSLAARYLREQGLAETTPFGLVDCGWSGTWTDIIGRLAESEGGAKPLVFFIGRRKRAADGCETLAWMFDHQNGSGLEDIPDFFHIVAEFLLTADHGRTIGFAERGGRLEAKLGPVDWQGFTPENWQVFRAALLGFAAAYAQQSEPRKKLVDLRPGLMELVRLFWEQPTVAEARFFAGHTIGLSPSRQNNAKLARAYRWPDVVRLAWRWQLPGYRPFWWHEGALVLSAGAVRKSMGLLWALRELLWQIRKTGKQVLSPKRLASVLWASARRLQRAFEQREDFEPCRFDGAETQPKPETQTVPSLPVTSPRVTSP